MKDPDNYNDDMSLISTKKISQVDTINISDLPVGSANTDAGRAHGTKECEPKSSFASCNVKETGISPRQQPTSSGKSKSVTAALKDPVKNENPNVEKDISV